MTTDASDNTIGGALSQEGYPVLYVSERLSTAERRYSNIEREALAIVYVIGRLRHSSLRKNFELLSDHEQPKITFFTSKEMPKTA